MDFFAFLVEAPFVCSSALAVDEAALKMTATYDESTVFPEEVGAQITTDLPASIQVSTRFCHGSSL